LHPRGHAFNFEVPRKVFAFNDLSTEHESAQ
jgi:hypothetical protein